MSKQPETLFKERVMRLLKEKYAEVYVTKVQQVCKIGDPDLLLCVGGCVGAAVTGARLYHHLLIFWNKLVDILPPSDIRLSYRELPREQYPLLLKSN